MAIFRNWEHQFHQGATGLDTHPGHGGINAEYDRLQSWLKEGFRLWRQFPAYIADFQALAGQDGLPAGILRELEVAWSTAVI
jgi:hypothetical protein